MKELHEIQIGIKCPKTRKVYNKQRTRVMYTYRNLDDIFEAAKPLLKKYKCFITKGDSQSTDGYAALMFGGGGMSAQQATGASSTYARKDALSGLLMLDDSELDPDNKEVQEELKDRTPAPKKEEPMTEEKAFKALQKCDTAAKARGLMLKTRHLWEGNESGALYKAFEKKITSFENAKNASS